MAVTNHRNVEPEQSKDSDEYRKIFRIQVFKLLLKGYQRLDKNGLADSEETDITGELVRVMMEYIEIDSTADWASRFTIHDNPPVYTSGRLGKRRKILDIIFERTEGGPHPRFSFEAKRLSKGKSGASEYFGPEGLGEFISGSYASRQNEAGMLGYVQSDTLDIWSGKLQDHFDKNRERLRVRKGGHWRKVKVNPSLSHSFYSDHNRDPGHGGSIDIYHVLLDFA